MGPRHPERTGNSRLREGSVAVLLALLLAACADSGPKVSTTVLAPAPATPVSQYSVEKTEVRSRETGDEAWQRNEQYARALAQQLRDALLGAGKTVVPPPAMSVRSRLYLAWQDPPSKGGVAQGDKARVEILLQVVDPDTRAVRYSTLTKSDIAPPKIAGYQYGDDRAANVQKALDQAVADFVSRL